MTDDDSAALNISRRKTLAALGTIGVASAGAGLGTSAYFSDQETFANNRLTAGTLDMVVDWEEHYSDWTGEETEYAEMPMGDEQPNYVLPAPDDNPNAQDIELVISDMQAFWDATAIEAYPDADNDALQDAIADPCNDLGSLDDVLSSDDRTDNEWTDPGDPLVSLQDVKPGDFGELTLSFHLCENPGFVWFGGDLITNADGENTEPEIDDPDEQQSAEDIGPDTPGELAQQIQVRVWYDDCDNMYEPETPAACAYHLFDVSGTMEQNLNTGDGDARDKEDVAADIAGQVTEHLDTIDDGGDDGTLAAAPSSVAEMGIDAGVNERIANSDDESAVIDEIDTTPDTSAGGISATELVDGLETAQATLEACENENKVLVVYTNADSRPGDEADRQDVYDAAAAAKAAGVTIKVVAFDVDSGSNAEDFLETVGDEVYLVSPAGTAADVDTQADDVASMINDQFDTVTAGETEFYSGTLLDFLTSNPFDPDNNQLGHPLDGDIPAEEGGGMGRNCFSATTTHCIGFEWWLPIDHGNEVQGDIVEFDLGFYTEQCRHNDGSGMNAEMVDGNDDNVES